LRLVCNQWGACERGGSDYPARYPLRNLGLKPYGPFLQYPFPARAYFGRDVGSH
jgi:hypothetical protein